MLDDDDGKCKALSFKQLRNTFGRLRLSSSSPVCGETIGPQTPRPKDHLGTQKVDSIGKLARDRGLLKSNQLNPSRFSLASLHRTRTRKNVCKTFGRVYAAPPSSPPSRVGMFA